MSIYFDKAREFGKLLLESDQGQRVTAAREAFDNNQEAVRTFEDFKAYQENIRESVKMGVMNQDEYTKASQNLLEKSDYLKKQPVINELLDSEAEFLAFVNQALGIIKATITGDLPENGCGGECGGCAGCKA